MDTEKRLKRLEASNMRLKYVLAAVCALVLALGSLAAAQAPGDGIEAVRARRFVLLDPEGRKRAALSMQDGSPELVMRDQEGTIKVPLKPRALKLGKDGTTLRAMLRRDGLQVRDKRARPRAWFGMLPTGSGLILRDGQQTRRVELGQLAAGSTAFVLRDDRRQVIDRMP